MDKDTKERIADYFDPWELIEYLGVPTEDIVSAFEEEVLERLEEIEELMGVSHD